MEELFHFSLLAERLSDRRGDTMDCPSATTLEPFVDIMPIVVPDHEVETLRYSEGGVFVERNDNINSLYVGCTNVQYRFDAAVEMSFYSLTHSNADVIQLNVVGRSRNETNEWVEVVPEINSNGELIFALGGAQSLMEFIAALTGGECVFSAVKFAVYKICEKAKERDYNSDFWFDTDEGRPTLVGHSLGGAAAQFIAKEDSLSMDCRGVNAYAFGSIGLNLVNPNHETPVRGSLKSYISNCDLLAQSLPFYNNVQLGELFTLSHTSKHSIDGIQEDLYCCLQSESSLKFTNYGNSQTLYPNNNLCN